MWSSVLKRWDSESAMSMLEYWLSPDQDIERVITTINTVRRQNPQDITALLSILSTYSRNKNKWFNSHKAELEDKMGFNRTQMKEKMDRILSEIGTKHKQKGSLALLELGREAEKTKNPEKIAEFLEKVPKSASHLRENPEIRRIKNNLEQLKREVKVVFSQGAPSKEILEEFAEITEGEVRGEEIVYPKLANPSEWRKNWALIPREEGAWYENAKGSEGDIFGLVKRYYPQVVKGDIIEDIQPMFGKYKAATFTRIIFNNYLQALTKDSKVKIPLFIPKTWKKGGSTKNMPKHDKLIYSTSTDKSVRINPLLSALLEEVNTVESFLAQMQVKPMSAKQREDLLINDILIAWEHGDSVSPRFELSVPKPDNLPESEDGQKRYIKQKLLVGQEDISTIAHSKGVSPLEDTISLKTMNVIEHLLEFIGSEARKELFEDAGIESLDFQSKDFGAVTRFVPVDGNKQIPIDVIDGLLKDIDRYHSKEVVSPPHMKELAPLSGKFHYFWNQLVTEDTTVGSIIDSHKLSMQLENVLSDTNPPFHRMLISQENLSQVANDTVVGEDVSLSNLAPEKIIAFFRIVDDYFGPSHDVSEGYKEIEDAKDKTAVAKKVEKKISSLLSTYREEIRYAFQSRLQEILDKNGIGNKSIQISPKLLKDLEDKGIVEGV